MLDNSLKSEIVIFRPDESSEHIEVKIEDETVWLTQQQIAELFDKGRSTITEHIKNVFNEGELEEEVVCREFRQTTQHGAIPDKTQDRMVKHYNLDVIISVGYRVKSLRGTQFRIWANRILKDYLLKGYVVNNRLNRIEDNVDLLSKKVQEIDLQLQTHLIPTQGVFFNGQVFDAYAFVSKIIR